MIEIVYYWNAVQVCLVDTGSLDYVVQPSQDPVVDGATLQITCASVNRRYASLSQEKTYQCSGGTWNSSFEDCTGKSILSVKRLI